MVSLGKSSNFGQLQCFHPQILGFHENQMRKCILLYEATLKALFRCKVVLPEEDLGFVVPKAFGIGLGGQPFKKKNSKNLFQILQNHVTV